MKAKKNKKAPNLLQRKRFDTRAINICVAICGFIAIITSGKSLLTLLINGIILFIMYRFLRAGLGLSGSRDCGLIPLRTFTRDLKKAIEYIKEQECDLQSLDDIFCSESPLFFEGEPVYTALKEYFEESNSLYREGNRQYYNCDIADYIHSDLANEVGNTSFNDFVSSVLTGLGILGTFIGLAVGLQSFNAETAEAMTSSIGPLIEGIKIAFYTSIFGVALSLLYGWLYKCRLREAEEAVSEFVWEFYKATGYNPENDAIARVLQIQEDQKDTMNQFAEDIACAFENVVNNSLAPVLTELPEHIAAAVQANVTPTMQAVGNSIQTLATELTENLAQAQNNGIENLVNQFLEQMNAIMGKQFEDLRQSVAAICDWQEVTTEKLQEVVSTICTNAESLASINKSLEKSIAAMASYIESIDYAQRQMSKEFSTASEQMSGQFSSASAQIANEFSAASAEIEETFVSAAEQLKLDISSASDQIGAQFTAASTQISSEFSSAITRMDENFTSASAQLKQEFASASTQLTKDFTAVTERLNQATAAVENLQNKTADALSGYQKILENSERISVQIAQQQKTASELTQHQLELIKSSSTKLAEQTDSIKKLCDTITSDMNQASKKLVSVSGQLANDVGEAMTRTYEQFDSQLAKAIEHFSGTLLELRDIVEKTPKMVDGTSAKMKVEMTSYLAAIRKESELQIKMVNEMAQQLSNHTKQVNAAVTQLKRTVDTMNVDDKVR